MQPIIFADDTNLLISGTSLQTLENKINNEIPVLTNWLQTNRLSLNLKKNHIMLFGPTKRNENYNINVTIEGEQIEIVKTTKFLGLILDNQISWKPHIAYLTQKVSKSIGILSRARQILSSTTMKQLYYSFLYPYMTYCNIIWGQAPSSTLWPLFKLQK